MKPDFQVGIVGAGFAGIIAALRLQQSKRDSFVIFERASQAGGTWRDNIYPGCACDVPSKLYSISFEPNPKWKEMYPSQPEILDYIHNVVHKNKLENHIRYDSEIIEYEFIENAALWKLTDRLGNTTLVKMLIMATGPFSRPQIPDIKGLDAFQGKTLHSSRWDKSYDLTGKRVAIIGTGASAIQIVPAIAQEVEHLTVFQRTAAWVATRMNHEITPEKQRHYEKFPISQRFTRGLLYWFLEFRGLMFMGNQTIHNYFAKLALQKIEREVQNAETRKKLTPNYKLGCKRILSSDDYLPTFNRANVSLEVNAIAEITANGILTESGNEHKVDTIILATGFEVADYTTDMRIYGRNGRELFGEWRENGLEAYRGTTISGYPNLTFILGPNTGLGHNSMIFMMESQMNYVIKYIDLLEKQSENVFLDLKADVQQRYNQFIHNQFQTTVWASGCNSWYINSRGRNTTLYPRLTARFRRETKKVDGNEYEIVRV